MATQPNYYDDGNWAAGFGTGFNPFEFPFGNNPTPDTFCRITEQMIAGNPINYNPKNGSFEVYENMLTYSEQFDNAAWTKADTTVTANAFSGPAVSSATADALLETATTAVHYAYQSFTAISPIRHVFSVCVKPFSYLGRNYVVLILYDSAAVSYTASFNIVTGTVFSVSANASANIVNAGNGYFLVSVSAVIASGTTLGQIIISQDGTAASYAGNTGYGLIIYGAQAQSARGSIQCPGAYIATTNVAKQTSLPFADGTADPFAFLVEEAPMQLSSLQKSNVLRSYARIPADQVYPASRIVVRPVMNDIYTGSYYAVSFDSGYTSTVFSSRKTISSIGTDLPPNVPVSGASGVPAGTLASLPSDTISIQDSGGHSTTFTLSSAPSSIQASLGSALTSLTGLCVVGSANSLSISWATGTLKYCSSSTAAQISSSPTNVNFSMPTSAANSNQSWTYIPNALQSLRDLGSTGHGGVVGDQVAVWNGSKLSCISRLVTSTTNAFTIPLSDLPGNDIVATHCEFAKNGTRYVNGPKECVVKRTQKFYLPGVTSGISSFANIPTYAPETDPISWLGAITAGNAYAIESVSDLSQWKGQILLQELNQVQMNDALVTVAPGS